MHAKVLRQYLFPLLSSSSVHCITPPPPPPPLQVNGFQVYDPEEAILLFLEQDQDITLSVARKIKVCTVVESVI